MNICDDVSPTGVTTENVGRGEKVLQCYRIEY